MLTLAEPAEEGPLFRHASFERDSHQLVRIYQHMAWAPLLPHGGGTNNTATSPSLLLLLQQQQQNRKAYSRLFLEARLTASRGQ